MKFKIKQKILLEHLNYAIKGISNKNLIPILNCIKFEVKTEGIYLISTDNELSIKTFIKKEKIDKIEILGEFVISGKYIYDIVKKLSNELITIEEILDYQILITTTTSSFKLNCNNVNEFPNIELEFLQKPILLETQVFKKIVNETLFATSNQESRPVLTGINFKINDNELKCTATDSYRLSKKSIKINDKIKEAIDIIVPSKNLLEITRLLNEEKEKIELHIFSNKIIFKINTIIIMSRLINGAYPDTDKLIPNSFNLKISVNLTEFYNSIDRASLLTNDEEKNIVNFQTKDDLLIISSNIPEIGNVEEKLKIQKDKKEEIKISFSSKYMLEAIKTFDCEEIELNFNGEIKPIIIKNKNDNSLVQLVLPIRTY